MRMGVGGGCGSGEGDWRSFGWTEGRVRSRREGDGEGRVLTSHRANPAVVSPTRRAIIRARTTMRRKAFWENRQCQRRDSARACIVLAGGGVAPLMPARITRLLLGDVPPATIGDEAPVRRRMSQDRGKRGWRNSKDALEKGAVRVSLQFP